MSFQREHAGSRIAGENAKILHFNAVESGFPPFRYWNRGVTSRIDARNAARPAFCDANGRVFGAGVMMAQILLLAPDEKRELTFYNRHGDRFGWGCVVETAVVLLPRLGKKFF